MLIIHGTINGKQNFAIYCPLCSWRSTKCVARVSKTRSIIYRLMVCWLSVYRMELCISTVMLRPNGCMYIANMTWWTKKFHELPKFTICIFMQFGHVKATSDLQYTLDECNSYKTAKCTVRRLQKSACHLGNKPHQWCHLLNRTYINAVWILELGSLADEQQATLQTNCIATITM